MRIRMKQAAAIAAACVLSLCSCGIVQERDSFVTLPESDGSAATQLPLADSAKAEPEVNNKVRFLAAGDNIIHECVYLDAAQAAAYMTAEYDFTGMYENISDEISAADIAFVNQEGPICSDLPVSGYPNFNAPDDAGQALADAGFDIVNIANNHMMDMGYNGLEKSIEFWRGISGVTLLGGYENQADYDDLTYVEKNGIKIALLSYTYGTNKDTYVTSRDAGCVVPVIDDSTVITQLAKARKNADFVIVYVHWGTESTISSKNMTYDEIASAGYTTAFSPTAEQERLAALMAENGADVILGGHSHTLQPVKWIENGDRKTLVSYSLGNFVSSQLTVQNLVGGMLEFDIVRGADGTVRAEKPVLIPTVCHYLSNPEKKDSLDLDIRYDIKMYLLRDYNEALASRHGASSYGKFTLQTLWDYAEKTIDAEFLEK